MRRLVLNCVTVGNDAQQLTCALLHLVPRVLIQPKTIDLSTRLRGGLFPRASYRRLSCWADSCMLCKLDETSDSQEFYYHQLNFDFKNNFGLCPHYGFILTGLGIYRLC